MTDLLGGAGQAEIWIEPDDKRALSIWYRQPYAIGEMQDFPSQGLTPGSYRASHWPGCGGMTGDAGDVSPLYGLWYCEPDLTRGGSGAFGIAGVTRDAYGQPLPFVTVKLYLTATDVLVYTTTSDGNGDFLAITAFYPNSHYLVFYKAGSPDIFATTQNTLIAG